MTAVASNNPDLLSELLIAKLLEEDMQLLESTRAAEELQFNEAVNSSALAAGRFPKKLKSGATMHKDPVLDVFASELVAAKDALLAQSMQQAEDSNMVVSRQYAQKLAAAEKKSMLDAEFARRLQQAVDDGEDIDAMEDAERSDSFNSTISAQLKRR